MKNYKELESEIFLIRDNDSDPNIWLQNIIGYYENQMSIIWSEASKDKRNVQKINKNIDRLIRNLYKEVEPKLNDDVKLLYEMKMK